MTMDIFRRVERSHGRASPRRAPQGLTSVLLVAALWVACSQSSHLFAGRLQRAACPSKAGRPPALREQPGFGRTVLHANWLDLLEDAAGVPTPEAAEPAIPHTATPLDAELVKDELTAYMLEEKALSMSGEDFEVKSPTGEVILKIGGGNRLPVPGVVWDKLSVTKESGELLATLDRQMFAMTTTYDILRPDGSKFGKIDKAMFALTSTFELWQDGDDQPGPLLKAEGSFSSKKYILKSHTGAVVASVARLPGFSSGNVDNYQVIVGPHVDATLVLAMAVVIDEVHDEENKDQEATSENFMNQLEDNSGLPVPKVPLTPIPSGMPPLDPQLFLAEGAAYELEEKALSMTGEDFDVKSQTGALVMKINGGNRIPVGGLPVWDKLTVSDSSGATLAIMDRELVSMTPTYDIFRPDGSRFGKIDKALLAMSETYEFFLEGEGSPVLKAEGSFSERRYTFKDREGLVVASAGRGYFQLDDENRYHVVVAGKVDASMVLMMAVVIDEVHDEQANRDKDGEGGGFPFR
mmetsp:Transcript_34148/g.76273  ORF Transcript_34148/g.76273 Transcript_34148/m.76273 type:complete len:522 (+) Transcript_34148:57-1622(+)